MGERGRNVWAAGPLLTLAAAGAVELVDRFLVHIPTPGVVVLLAAAYAAYLGGFRAGLASSLVAVLYSAWTLSEPGAVFHYAPESAVRLAVLLAATPGTALLVGVLRDRLVRETLRAAELHAEHRRRSLEEAFGVLFRHNPLPMWVYDVETLHFLAVNRAAVAHYGYSEEEFLRMRITEIRPEEDVPRLLEDIRRPRPEFQQSGVWRHRTKDGRVLHVEVSSHRLEFAGRPAVLVVAQDVTDRVRTEQALQESEEMFRNLVEHSPLGVFVLQDGRAVYVNQAAAAIFGDTVDQALALPAVRERVHPDDWPTVERELGRVLAGDAPHVSFAARGLRRDGTMVHVEVHGVRTTFRGRPAVLGTLTDVTARRRAEEALRESEEKFRSLVEQSLVGVYLIQDGVFRYVNPALATIFGYTRQELLEGMGPRDVTHPEDWPLVQENLRRRLEGEVEAVQYGFRGVRKDGRVIHVEVHGRRTVYEGRPAVIGTLVDVTERKQAEEALRALTQELEERVQERTAQLEAANRELEAFSYSVAHDLRAPLRSIDGFSQALLEDYGEQLDETGQDYLRRVRAASQRMGELIDDLLRLSRVARSPMQLQEVDLSALVARIGAELRQRAAGRAVELRVQAGVVARADPKLLAVALENLLDNAWKFTAPRPQALVEFGVVQTEGGLACFVRDNGVGFDLRYADKLFAPFQRLHKPSEFPGTGIGLATVQRVVARHGGKVWAQAQVDGGATFYFTLPGLEVRGAAETDPAGGGQPG
ncbi:MAG: PAS domain S-box protein [Armatimonadota bacterium]|nr:PAS domain S-box protein [Armatimonadota bacterium]MDR7410243.1 PAS domain S-box protein [Armatimonadota bacterium]MDR7423894.1 PAS domain S-box protein [Armatimonadota bacterium]MDR7442216.1 PAS domain S-box protein [Armatimonadota bacterium]MDR7600144.1 PAS domain S-box protein [Armatimonadota bacterium]